MTLPWMWTILDMKDQPACYQKLLALLHPDGLSCPRCGDDRLTVHRHHKDSPVVDHRRTTRPSADQQVRDMSRQGIGPAIPPDEGPATGAGRHGVYLALAPPATKHADHGRDFPFPVHS